MPTSPARLPRWMRWPIGWLCLLALLSAQALLQPMAWTQVSAVEPAQSPLITREGGQPSPNVMLTLDTSWSMIFPYLPEGAFTVNEQTVHFPGFTSPIMHPGDHRYDASGGQNTDKAEGDGGAIPADLSDTTNVFQRQMRSPQVNQLYYNPAEQYKPWLISKDLTTGNESRYPAADPKKAWFDPDKAYSPNQADYATQTCHTLSTTDTPCADLTAAATHTVAFWCTAPPTQPGGKLSCGQNGKAFSKSFHPAVYFLLTPGANPNAVSSYTSYDLVKQQIDGNTVMAFPKSSQRSDCAGTSCTPAEELQNYANWFVYYRTRLHVVQAAVPESFLQIGNTIRLGWGTIHQPNATLDGANTAIVQAGVRDFDASRKAAMVSWLRHFKSDSTINSASSPPKLSGGTPLLAALTGVGEYFARTDPRNPWVTDPAMSGGDTSAPLSCRRAYNMLITDGYYDGSSGVLNEDGTNGPLISHANGTQTYAYQAATPYMDSQSGTLADVAMKYWKNDLSNAINNVPYGNDTPGEDPAFWQHLVQLPIGLGVDGKIPLKDLDQQMALLASGAKGWWDGSSTVAKTDPRRIDDLLHAAVNTRGTYFSARTAAELTQALSSALTRAGDRSGLKEAGIATASLTLSTGNVKYIPEYTTARWTGNIKAYTLDTNGHTAASPTWRAADKVPAASKRQIFTWDGSNGTAFSSTMAQALLDEVSTTGLPSGASAIKLVNYIRGDSSLEDNSQTIGLFRKRTGKLPDFINANPLLIQGHVNLGYDKLLTGAPGQALYNSFISAKSAREPVLLIGGNGGMLHAFADYTNTEQGIQPGQEVFAYVPRVVLPHLRLLARKDYGVAANNGHRFYVDGPLAESDLYMDGAWRNVVAGTLGAGGRALFLLDVTASHQLGAHTVMLEKSHADQADMGYMFGAPQVGRLPSGEWAAFVGNGAHSNQGKSALLLIKLTHADGSTVQQPTVTAIVAESALGNNGMGAIRLVKDSNQNVTAIYAGDLKGQVWRFDVTTNGATSSLVVGMNHKPLFQTANATPITAAPAVISHPSGGHLVIVGTGKLFDEGDNDDTSTPHTVYAVWDKLNGLPTFEVSTDPRASGQLVEQVIYGSAVGDTGGTYYSVSTHSVDYSSKLGWFMNLTLTPGQRTIYAPTIIQNHVLISTMVPAPAAALCDKAGGAGYNFLLPALTGAQHSQPILDTTGDGLIDSSDQLVSGYKTGADGHDTPLTDSDTISLQHTTGQQKVKLPAPVKGKKITGRVWRQLMSPPAPTL